MSSSRIELDYASGSFISMNFVDFQSDYDLQVCPLGTFRPQNFDMNCYRDSLTEVQLLHFMTPRGIVVTPYFSNFISTNLRDSAWNYFNYSWTIDVIYGPLGLNQN